ncbi:MAG TPA: ABC transporter permease subunit [Herpetosiphonaceae bacterium]
MWFRSIFLKTIRDYRIPILAWGLGFGAMVLATMTNFAALSKDTDLRETLLTMAPSLNWFSEAVEMDTPAGYVFWKLGPTLLAPCIWALLAGSRMLRGEEERGSLDVLLSLPRSRRRVALEKLAALGVALLVIGLLIGLLTFSGAASARAGFGLGAALLFGLNISLIAAVFAALALLISQFTRQRGTAAGIAGAALAASFALDSSHRVVPDAAWLGYLSPTFYFNQSKPLIASYGASAGAMLTLAALAAAFSAAALWLFLRRDIGEQIDLLPAKAAPAPRPSAAMADGWSLRSVYGRFLRMALGPGRWWALGMAVFAAWLTTLFKQLETNLAGLLQQLSGYGEIITALGGQGVDFSTSLLSAYFVFLVMILTAFAATQANRWAADEDEGRLEMLLATPRSRRHVILASFAALATAAVAIALVTLGAIAAAAASVDFELNLGNLVAAALSMVPLALVVAAVGYLLSGWLRAGSVAALLSGLLAVSFVANFLGAILGWPEAALQLSIYHHYGTPLISGPQWAQIGGLLAAAGGAFAIALTRFRQKDIAR